jgi:hypothetical protein
MSSVIPPWDVFQLLLANGTSFAHRNAFYGISEWLVLNLRQETYKRNVVSGFNSCFRRLNKKGRDDHG